MYLIDNLSSFSPCYIVNFMSDIAIVKRYVQVNFLIISPGKHVVIVIRNALLIYVFLEKKENSYSKKAPLSGTMQNFSLL